MFGVPERYAAAISALGSLSEGDFGALEAHLRDLPGFATRSQVVSAIRTVGDDHLDAGALTDAVTSLLSLEIEMEPSALAAAVIDSLDDSLIKPSRDVLIERFQYLLERSAIISITKATRVLTDHEHVFLSARILTDIRPVFGEDVDTQPEAAVIVSTLRIDHSTDGARKKAYFALDRGDLEQLKRVVDRALTKTDSLVDFLTTAGLTYYDPYAEGSDEND